MKIAVEGCMHGELDKVYDTMRRLEEAEGIKIDLLICCGDFQAVRNESDLHCVNVKPKYRTMNSFWKYYSGQAVAPYPTIFIGGNHEASNYLWELNEELDIQNDRQWVRSKLNARGAKPFDFVQTAPPFNPSMPVDNPHIAGVNRNASSSQPAHPLNNDDIELPDEIEDDE
ncbi:hypothetical protein ACQ4PT_071541 [Festuca glaucescens]